MKSTVLFYCIFHVGFAPVPSGTRGLVLTTYDGDIISEGELPLPAETWKDSETWLKKDEGNYSVENFVGLTEGTHIIEVCTRFKFQFTCFTMHTIDCF